MDWFKRKKGIDTGEKNHTRWFMGKMRKLRRNHLSCGITETHVRLPQM